MSELLWDVFISYKRDPDEELALDLLGALERAGLRCWFAPRDVRSTSQRIIASGKPSDGGWDDAIPFAIENSKTMVILVSKAAMESKQIQKEIYLGDDANIQFFPVLIEEVPLERSFKYHLGRAQWINCFTGEGSQRFLNVASDICGHLGIAGDEIAVADVIAKQTQVVQVSPTGCPKCGALNLPGTKFCEQCGESLMGNLSNEAELNKMARRRFEHADGSVVFLDHRQVWVGYAEGRIVCTKASAEKVIEFLKRKFGVDGVVFEGKAEQ